LLLDTHVLLWWLADDEALDDSVAAQEIRSRQNVVFVSAASAWEISIKRALGKLVAPNDLQDQIGEQGFEPLSMDVAHALVAGSLPQHHRDPFDRMLVAQAQLEDLTVVTRDPSFALYGVATIAA
jgi:PIN domain nuclease of toxin-antitoxin system